jgi:hypothetical protein
MQKCDIQGRLDNAVNLTSKKMYTWIMHKRELKFCTTSAMRVEMYQSSY